MTPLTAPGVQPRDVKPQVAKLPVDGTGSGYGICSGLTVSAPAWPRVSSHETVKDGAGPWRGRE